jgi:predicted NAD/FAD-dependent oxidoreductase
MIGLDAAFRLPFDGLFVNQGPLRWVARNASKPRRDGNTWILHATPDWSSAHLDDPQEAVIALLLDALADVSRIAALPHGRGAELVPYFAEAHRWLYSSVADPLTDGCLWDPALGIGACGDWCAGARVEGAWLSGEALAGRVLGQLMSA